MNRFPSLLSAGAVATVLLAGTPGTAGAATQIVDLGFGRATAVNERDVVVGTDQYYTYGLATSWDAEGNRTGLGTLPGYTHSYADDINERDTVVGTALTLDPENRTLAQTAVRWDRDRRISRLGDVRGRPFSNATAINDLGVAIGSAGTTTGPDTQMHAVRWDRSGTALDLGSLPDYPQSSASAINSGGVIAGIAYRVLPNYSTVTRAVRWDRNGRIADLATPPGEDQSVAVSVNEAGTVAGYTFASGTPTNGLPHPVTWDSTGKLTRLTIPPGGIGAVVKGINADGTVIGDVLPDTSGRGRAVAWDRDGRVTALGPIGDTSSSATGINRHGMIAGSIDSSATLWDRRGRATPLGTLPGGGPYSDAWRINDRGSVIGHAQAADGQFHAVLWRTRNTAG